MTTQRTRNDARFDTERGTNSPQTDGHEEHRKHFENYLRGRREEHLQSAQKRKSLGEIEDDMFSMLRCKEKINASKSFGSDNEG
jgi:hypothetical protein